MSAVHGEAIKLDLIDIRLHGFLPVKGVLFPLSLVQFHNAILLEELGVNIEDINFAGQVPALLLPVATDHVGVHVGAIVGGFNRVIDVQLGIDVRLEPFFLFIVHDADEIGFSQLHRIA